MDAQLRAEHLAADGERHAHVLGADDRLLGGGDEVCAVDSVCHAFSPTARELTTISPRRQHRATCDAETDASAMDPDAPVRHCSAANAQRGWNRQPLGNAPTI